MGIGSIAKKLNPFGKKKQKLGSEAASPSDQLKNDINAIGQCTKKGGAPRMDRKGIVQCNYSGKNDGFVSAKKGALAGIG